TSSSTPSSGSSGAIRTTRRWWMYQSPPFPTRSHRSGHGRRSASAREQHQPTRRSRHQQRQPEPVALPLARAAAERGEDEVVARGGLAGGGEELSQPFLLLGGEHGATPLDILLKRAEAA